MDSYIYRSECNCFLKENTINRGLVLLLLKQIQMMFLTSSRAFFFLHILTDNLRNKGIIFPICISPKYFIRACMKMCREHIRHLSWFLRQEPRRKRDGGEDWEESALIRTTLHLKLFNAISFPPSTLLCFQYVLGCVNFVLQLTVARYYFMLFRQLKEMARMRCIPQEKKLCGRCCSASVGEMHFLHKLKAP